MLRFLVVKSLIAADGDQLRISFIILQTSRFLSSKVGQIQICLGTRGAIAPVTPVLNTPLPERTLSNNGSKI